MLARLGEVLWWSGFVVAVLWILISGYVFLASGFDGPPRVSDYLFIGFIVLCPAAIFWLIGRGARYVLAGH